MTVSECTKIMDKIAQTQILIPVILFLVKKMVKNRYCENENFSLARDRIELFRNHIRVYENCIKVLEIMFKNHMRVQDY